MESKNRQRAENTTRIHRRTRPSNLNLVLVAVDADAHALFKVGGRDHFAERHDVLGHLFDINDVLGVLRVGIDDFGVARHLGAIGQVFGFKKGEVMVLLSVRIDWARAIAKLRRRTCNGCSCCSIC